MFGIFGSKNASKEASKDAAILVRTLQNLVDGYITLPDEQLFDRVRREFPPNLHAIENGMVVLVYPDFLDFKFDLSRPPFDQSASRTVYAMGRGRYLGVSIVKGEKSFAVYCQPTMHGPPSRNALTLRALLVRDYGFLSYDRA